MYISNERSGIDCMAEEMWRIASGEVCDETWATLPESQKASWRSCADHAMRLWMGPACNAYNEPHPHV